MSARGVSVFIPALNEEAVLEANVERLLAFLKSLGVPFEIIVGSNGSTDRTASIGRALARRHPEEVVFFELAKRGPGAAFREAARRARRGALITLDADLSADLGFIPRALAALDDHEIVVGSKKAGVERRSSLRRLGSDLFIWCSKRLLGLPFNDYSLGAKAYDVAALERYLPLVGRGTFYVQRVVHSAWLDGRPIVELPVDCDDRRRSRFNLPLEATYRFACLFLLYLSRIARCRGAFRPSSCRAGTTSATPAPASKASGAAPPRAPTS